MLNSAPPLLRAVTLGAAVVVLGFGVPDAHASDSSSEKGTSQSKTAESTADPWEHAAEPPNPYRFAVGVTPMLVLQKTAYRARESAFTGGLSTRMRITGPAFATLGVEFSHRSPDAGPLVVRNSHGAALAGGGAEAWLGRLRFSAQAQAGAQIRILALADNRGVQYQARRWQPVFGGQIAMGASFFDNLLISLDSGIRYFAPARADIYTGLHLGWLFVPNR